MTFLDAEKAVARCLRDRVPSTADTISVEDVREIATRRQAGHWASPSVPGAPAIPRKGLYAVYEALVAAAELFDLRNQHRDEFDDAPSMYRAY